MVKQKETFEKNREQRGTCIPRKGEEENDYQNRNKGGKF